MQKSYPVVSGLAVLLAALAICGCNKQDKAASGSPGKAPPGAYFKTPWQDESQFIVTAIVSDLAEITYCAKNQRPPNPRNFSVTATGKPDSQFGAPVYLIEVCLDKSIPVLKTELPIKGSIWCRALWRPRPGLPAIRVSA